MPINFTFNLDPKLFRQVVDAIVQLAADYRAVHCDEIDQFEQRKEKLKQGSSKGRVFYQSDRKLHEQEVKERLRAEAETGGAG